MKPFKIWLEDKLPLEIVFISFPKEGDIKLYVNGEKRIIGIDGLYIRFFKNLSLKSPLLAYEELLKWVDAGRANDITFADDDPKKTPLPRP